MNDDGVHDLSGQSLLQAACKLWRARKAAEMAGFPVLPRGGDAITEQLSVER